MLVRRPVLTGLLAAVGLVPWDLPVPRSLRVGAPRTSSRTSPTNAVVSKVFTIGPQLVSVGAGLRYWAESPDSGPRGFGARMFLTLLFPR